MKKRKPNRKVISSRAKTVANVASPIFSALSLINPTFLIVPVVCSVANELFSYFDAKSTENRLKSLQDAVTEKGIAIETFAGKLNDLDEHGMYVVRNNLKHLCLSALPETVDAFNQALIDYIMSEEQGMAEESCEIIKQLNANDISLLKRIKSYIRSGDRTQYNRIKEELLKEREKDEQGKNAIKTAGYQRVGFKDRNIFWGENTIIWDDFCPVKPAPIGDEATLSLNLYHLLNGKFFSDDNIPTYEMTFTAKSIVKMQNMGVIEVEFITTAGSTSLYNISRFHITHFGQKILEYI